MSKTNATRPTRYAYVNDGFDGLAWEFLSNTALNDTVLRWER
jgi:hypothetical protein